MCYKIKIGIPIDLLLQKDDMKCYITVIILQDGPSVLSDSNRPDRLIDLLLQKDDMKCYITVIILQDDPSVLSDSNRAERLIDFLLQKDDLECYEGFRKALYESGHRYLPGFSSKFQDVFFHTQTDIIICLHQYIKFHNYYVDLPPPWMSS